MKEQKNNDNIYQGSKSYVWFSIIRIDLPKMGKNISIRNCGRLTTWCSWGKNVMWVVVIQFSAMFVAVFFKGFQHQNVIGGKYKSAFVVSYIMAVLDVAVISLVVKAGWSSVIPLGTGAGLGIIASMYLYRATEEHGLTGYIKKLLRGRR